MESSYQHSYVSQMLTIPYKTIELKCAPNGDENEDDNDIMFNMMLDKVSASKER